MRTAYLHIGMPKTGTTAIQLAMVNARQRLAKNGLLYPGTEDDHRLLLPRFHPQKGEHFVFANRGISPEDAEDLADDFLIAFQREVFSSDGDVLLSSEYLYDLDTEGVLALKELFRDLKLDLKIVCYVRHPLAMATSAIQQNVKMGTRPLQKCLNNPVWHSFSRALTPYMRVLGKDKVLVRTFEAAREMGVERDILSLIGHGDLSELVEPLRTNESLSLVGVYAADAHNTLMKQVPHLKLPKHYLFKIGGQKFSLPPEVAGRIKERSAHELVWLKEKFGLTLEEPKMEWPDTNEALKQASKELVTALARRAMSDQKAAEAQAEAAG